MPTRSAPTRRARLLLVAAVIVCVALNALLRHSIAAVAPNPMVQESYIFLLKAVIVLTGVSTAALTFSVLPTNHPLKRIAAVFGAVMVGGVALFVAWVWPWIFYVH